MPLVLPGRRNSVTVRIILTESPKGELVVSTVLEILRETEVTLPTSLVRALERALRRERWERQKLREEGLRAQMQAASQASLARKTALRQEPVQRGSGRQEPAHQEPDLAPLGVADSGRVVRVGGDLITNNTPGRPDITSVGRARPTKPIQSVKSKIVPEPDQIQSAPPGRRRSSPLEPPGS
jgi:hypothetical protein